MINYYCPDFVVGRKFYEILLNYQRDFSEMFYSNVKIKTIFGNFPNCIWNGGGTFFGDLIHEIEDIQYFLDFYIKNNITLQFTMTNPLITEIDCLDRYGNFLLALLENCYSNDVEILVSSEILKNYIEKNYPALKISRSVVNSLENVDYKQMLKDYYNVVLPIKFTNDFSFLKQFTQSEKNHIEILCSDRCTIDCPRINQHYTEFAKASLYLGSSSAKINNKILCTNAYSDNLLNLCHEDRRFLITYQDFLQNYVPKGFFNCKLTGRGSLINLASNVIAYMIKPEYQLGFFKTILMDCGY